MRTKNVELLEKVEHKLLSIRHHSSSDSHANLTKNEIFELCDKVKAIYQEQPTLLNLTPPLTIVGDVHGQFLDLLRIFEITGYPPKTNFLFMGDYVDRGKQSIETVCLLFVYKIRYPKNFFMLRGNHECSYINRIYGFYDECCSLYDIETWEKFSDVFKYLPIAAIVEDKIFCVHGGISPHLKSLDDIKSIERPVEVPEEGLLCDLLWSDPNNECEEWEPNDRGTSYCFGPRQVSDFLKQFNFDLICRAHQAVMDGFEFPFQDHQNIVTVFSAPNYCYEYENRGAILHVDENLFCNFSVLPPLLYKSAEPSIVYERGGTPPRANPVSVPDLPSSDLQSRPENQKRSGASTTV